MWHYQFRQVSDSSLLTVPVRNEIVLSQMMMDNLIQNKEH